MTARSFTGLFAKDTNRLDPTRGPVLARRYGAGEVVDGSGSRGGAGRWRADARASVETAARRSLTPSAGVFARGN